ncbi:MAG: sulfotransferase domain-containing protein, partial [Aggregatilineales bacterium]
DVDLGKAPFVFLTQYEQAQRFIAVPYAVFKQLADQLPVLNHFIFIYTTGRSGSTLLSSAFNEVDTVLSLSEIDAITQLVYLRTVSDQRDAELRDLLDRALRFAFKPTAFKKPATCVLKLQSEALEIMDLLQATLPQAKNLFLYRDAVSWVASFYRILKRTQAAPDDMLLEGRLAILKKFFDTASQQVDPIRADRNPDVYAMQDLMQLAQQLVVSNPRATQDFGHLAAYLDQNSAEISTVQILTLWWISIMEWYLAKTNSKTPILPLRYTDMNARPQETITKVFDYCELPNSEVTRALRAFDKDSHEGTAMARDKAKEGNQLQLSDNQINEIITILKRHPILKDPNFIIPGTLSL